MATLPRGFSAAGLSFARSRVSLAVPLEFGETRPQWALRRVGLGASKNAPAATASAALQIAVCSRSRVRHTNRAHRGAITSPDRCALDSFSDRQNIADRKRSETQMAILAREVERRAKNVLASVQATVVSQSSRGRLCTL